MNTKEAQQSNTIRAKRLELIDSQGRVRAVFGIGEDNQPSLQLLRQDGSMAFSLSTYVLSDADSDQHETEKGECSRLEFFDMQGISRMRLQMSDEWPQYPGISLIDSEGKRLIGLVVTPDDDAEIVIEDGYGRPIWMKRNR